MAAATRTSVRLSTKAGVAARPARATRAAVKAEANFAQKAGQFAAGVAAGATLLANSAGAANLTKDEFNSLTYLQVKGTGVANTCATVAGDESELQLPSGTYKLEHLCLEPTSFTVKDEYSDKFVGTKLMTRLTYTLDEISGKATIGSDGKFAFKEEDGIDYAATTVQLPGGERVPFLFTVKELDAKGTTKQFGGDFAVPSYRGSSFLDPKGRGGSTGYDDAVGLGANPSNDELANENFKSTATLTGSIVFSVAKVDNVTGELAGVFESIQPSDTDLGSKAPKDIKIQGLWYAQLEQ